MPIGVRPELTTGIYLLTPQYCERGEGDVTKKDTGGGGEKDVCVTTWSYDFEQVNSFQQRGENTYMIFKGGGGASYNFLCKYTVQHMMKNIPPLVTSSPLLRLAMRLFLAALLGSPASSKSRAPDYYKV